jgi:hypothetical protein
MKTVATKVILTRTLRFVKRLIRHGEIYADIAKFPRPLDHRRFAAFWRFQAKRLPLRIVPEHAIDTTMIS